MRFVALVCASVWGLDVLTKQLVRLYLPFGQEISLLPFFSLVHVSNTGMAFGLFQNRNWALFALGVFVVGYLVYWSRLMIDKNPFLKFPLGLVLGGALGNLLDRVWFGHVTDFLDFFIDAHHWPAFNVADSAICVGAFLLLWHNLKRNIKL